MRLLAGLALVLLALAGVAAHAAGPEPVKDPVMVLPGTITTDRFAEGVPDLGYDPSWEWLALVCERTCALEPVKLTLRPVKVQPYDGDPMPGHVYGIDRALDTTPLVLMRNLPGSIRKAETWLHAGLGTYPPSSTGGTREIDIPLPGGARARIVPRYAGVIDGNPVLRVYLEAGRSRQLLGEQIVDAIGGPATLARGPQMLQWAGDLDGDGKLDLVLNLSSRYDEDAEALLFLSSMARDGDMVGKAAGFSYWPVGNAGC